MYLIYKMHNLKLILVVFKVLFISLVLCNVDIEEEVVEEEIAHHHHKFGLKVEIYPVDIIKMYQLTDMEVTVRIEANWTLMYNLSHSIKLLPIWFRCPGVIEVVSDNPALLEIINGTLNVTGEDFISLNHTVTLRSHHIDPAFQYLQIHWNSLVSLDECADITLHDEHLPEHLESEPKKPLIKQTLMADLHKAEQEPKEEVKQKSNIEPELEAKEDLEPSELEPTLEPVEDSVVETVPVEDQYNPTNTDDFQEEHIESDNANLRSNINIEGQSLKSEIQLEKPEQKFNIYEHGMTFQNFRKRRDTNAQDTSEIHHHHHYDRSDITVKITATPKTEVIPGLLLLDDYRVGVMRTQTTLDTAFVIVVTIVVAFNTFMMGMQLDLNIVIQVFKKPIGPVVGLISQFVFMPLASYGLAHLFFSDINLQLGLFTLGCSPGGNSSNFWTLLLKGDLNLSITMTFISTTCAIFMMPFWLLTLGQTILTRGQIEIPILNLFMSLVSFTVPVSIGIVVGKFRPNWAKKGKMLIRPVTFIFIIVVNVMAICNSMYIYRAMTWKTVLAGLCVAWGGYLFGGTLAFIARQKRAQIIAISIETAIQNPGVTFMVLRLTLDQPAADLSAVAPVSQMMVTTLPLLLLYLIIMIRRKILARINNGEEEPENSNLKTSQNQDKNSADVEKPLIVHNVTISPSKDYTDDKIRVKPHLKPILSPDVVNAESKRTGNEPVYENVPVGPRITIIGESNV